MMKAHDSGLAAPETCHQRRWLGLLTLIFFTLLPPMAKAATFCDGLKKIIAAAPTEFADFRGQKLDGPEGFEIYLGKFSLHEAESCAATLFSVEGKPVSSGYTCSFKGQDSDEGLSKLQGDIKTCLNIEVWQSATALGDTVQTLAAQYGLFKLSISRNGPAGLGLGVEAFRDEAGSVFGSPTRRSSTPGSGKIECKPKSADQIMSFGAVYADRQGAEFFQNEEFFGFTNAKSSPVVVFWTKPIHPAHPALIVRDVIQEGSGTNILTKGDFAGDCLAFHALLNQVVAMNQKAQSQLDGKN